MAIKVKATETTETTEATGTDMTAAPMNNALAAFSAINLFNVEPPKPSNSISIACFGATSRDSATIGVEQNSPILTPGVAKRA